MEEDSQKLFEIRMLEQQYNQIQAQIDSIKKVTKEIKKLKSELSELKIGKEILASVGKGVFVKAQILSEKLKVDIGGKNIIEKTIPETKNIISMQIKKLNDVQKELEENLEKLRKEILEKLGEKN